MHDAMLADVVADRCGECLLEETHGIVGVQVHGLADLLDAQWLGIMLGDIAGHLLGLGESLDGKGGLRAAETRRAGW